MHTVEELEERLSRPSPGLIGDVGRLSGDVIVLGAAGKLGPSLVRLAVRAVAEAGGSNRVIAVSRFSSAAAAELIRDAGADVIVADISDEVQLQNLPDAENVIFQVGAKFGTSGNESSTWATNAYLPGRIAEKFRHSKIAALSTGNVYPLTPVTTTGPTEDDPVGPVGEYAMSCLGRERVLAHFSERSNTPMSLLRLNYATELRYGVLVDIAHMVAHGQPVDLSTGHANVIWQGYANEVTIRSLLRADIPPFVLNVTSAEMIMVRDVAEQFGELLGRPPTFVGAESATALLSDATKCRELYGPPEFGVPDLIEKVAWWISHDQPLLDKPTKFQSRDGRF